MKGYTEKEYYSQQEVLNHTEGVGIVKIRTDTHYDIAWELADRRIVAFMKGSGGGCDTCGYGAGEDQWYILTPNK